MKRLLVVVLIVLSFGIARADEFYVGAQSGFPSVFGAQIGWNSNQNFGIRFAAGWAPFRTWGLVTAAVNLYAHVLLDSNQSSFYAGVGPMFAIDSYYYGAGLDLLVGFDWRPSPDVGIFLEFNPGLPLFVGSFPRSVGGDAGPIEFIFLFFHTNVGLRFYA